MGSRWTHGHHPPRRDGSDPAVSAHPRDGYTQPLAAASSSGHGPPPWSHRGNVWRGPPAQHAARPLLKSHPERSAPGQACALKHPPQQAWGSGTQVQQPRDWPLDPHAWESVGAQRGETGGTVLDHRAPSRHQYPESAAVYHPSRDPSVHHPHDRDPVVPWPQPLAPGGTLAHAPREPTQAPLGAGSWAHVASGHPSGHVHVEQRERRGPERCLILLQGLPGSGKSTLARKLVAETPHAEVLSTDDFFMHQGHYCFDPSRLGEAHQWNQERAKQAIRQGCPCVIIDNTNTRAWEMYPYAKYATRFGYRVEIREPDTPWRYSPETLAKRNSHGVPVQKIEEMLSRLELGLTPADVLRSGRRQPP